MAAKSQSRGPRTVSLIAPGVAGAVDGEARRIRPAVAHGAEHAGQQRAELGFERAVLEEQSDNAAHRRKLARTGLSPVVTVHAEWCACQLPGTFFSREETL